ncbi:hypothetical protein [Glutamicibacter arilaitensis]|uniref:hypothetical protein n=1 Tax=Glutamicibacter arilaitensis TaxID=256701 RepID=UPI00384B2D7E
MSNLGGARTTARSKTGGLRAMPLLCGAIWALLLFLVDPLLSGGPWWNYVEVGLWFALGLPVVPWLGIAGLMALLGFVVSTRLSRVLLSLTSVGWGIIPSTIWSLLLSDVFPDAGSLQITFNVSLAAGTAAIALSLVVLARTLVVRRKESRQNRSVPSNAMQHGPSSIQ